MVVLTWNIPGTFQICERVDLELLAGTVWYEKHYTPLFSLTFTEATEFSSKCII
jgi:hypothetical protein